MTAALPTTQEAKLDDLPDVLGAYNACLALENKATTEEDRVDARILGYMILNAPGSSDAQAEVIKAINSCVTDEKKLLELGKCFRLWFILPLKKSRGRTPTPSEYPSNPQFNRLKEELKVKITAAPRDHRAAKSQALFRDGYKCAVTGTYDRTAVEASLVDLDVATAAGGMVRTELAHILPQSTYFNLSNTPTNSLAEKDYAASVLAVLKSFGYDVEKVNGHKVHSLYNVMTLEPNAHTAFDRLELWFESTEVENRYRVQTTYLIPRVLSEVTFVSPDPLTFPYPSHQLLALHAACAKVAHLSGAGEYINKFDRDADDLDVLATDGSSSAILTHALWGSVSHTVDIPP